MITSEVESAGAAASVLVICLCAEWCDVCRGYRSRFEQVRQDFPQAQFIWIDVEDEEALMGPIEVSNFPTILIAVDDEPRFFAPLLARAESLAALLRTHIGRTARAPLSNAELRLFTRRIRLTAPARG